MDVAKLEKLKVAELRNELQMRGLDTKGVKVVLIERLKTAIDNTPVEGGSSEINEVSTQSRRSRRTRSMTRSASPSPVIKNEPKLEPVFEEDGSSEINEVSTPSRRRRRTCSMTCSPSPSPVKKIEPKLEPLFEEEKIELIELNLINKDVENISEEKCQVSFNNEKDDSEANTNEQDKESQENNEAIVSCVKTKKTNEISTSDFDLTPEKNAPDENTVEAMDVEKVLENSKNDSHKNESDSKTDENDGTHTEKKEKRLSRKRTYSKSRSRSRSRSQSKKSRSRSPKVKKSTSAIMKNIDESTNEEDEPVIEDKQFGLSWVDSDLHLTIDPVTFTSAKPMSEEIYSLVWSGTRTNYGVREGKVCYEVRLAEETNANQFKDEPFIRGLRCGFSTTKTSLLLGEGENSFAYCENGRKALNGEFTGYGKPFKIDDVIGCYLDLDSTPCTIQFTLNSEELGTAFEFNKEILGDEDALFPHILVKGYEVSLNFADSENLLCNMERPKSLLLGKEKSRKDILISEDNNAKDIKNTEDNWEIVDEVKIDDFENDDDKKEDGKKTAEIESKETHSEIEKSNEKDAVEVEVKNKNKIDESSDIKELEVHSNQNKINDQNQGNQSKETFFELQDAKENGNKIFDKKKENRDSKDSSQDIAVEKIESEERKEMVLLPGYELIALTLEDKFISGPQRPDSRKQCEVYLLVGLPGSGKTHWTLNHIKENPEKRYHVIGADNLISKMTIDGKPRKHLHKGNWERVYEFCLQSLSALEEIATKRRRNYILDQTNAFASAQRRKMKGFGDFNRNAVVCIPSEEELKKRNQLRTEAGTENTIRESTLNNLKASFTLPSLEFGWFDNIYYTDLKDDEAKNEVKRYNEKGRKDIEASRDPRVARRENRSRESRRRHEELRTSRWKANINERRGGSGNRWGPSSRGSSASWVDDRGYGGGRSYDNRNNRYSSGGGGWVNNNRNRYDDRFGGRSGGNNGGGSRNHDSYCGGSRDRGRGRNGENGFNASRRDGSYRSANNQRDFRSGHRDNRTEDNRGGFERSKYSSNEDGYAYHKLSGHQSSSSSQGKWMQMQGGENWVGQQQMQQQQYWGYDQSQRYENQQQAQWTINNADPRQQQWVNWYKNNSQQQQGNIMSNNSSQQYWSQYSYPNQDGTNVMNSRSSMDGSLKK
ncbi:heterogeneous nuclear ribonucleoprotein U-like protein 2 [Episyrphus balteatus]|uniref:heterogeneous nuclear ribonucleoprotein U-like protein 2 n=1 Tax=Episyrphus balteatus TaxID=286459 RepID=UPI00248535BD|nr:heterogeneous nuclear ribonucleoprotein U-like protein 2 [Episyrphus balteatus]